MSAPDQTERDIVWAKRLARIACLWREGDADQPWTDIATALGKAREEGRREALAHLAEAKRAHVPQRQAALRGENVADDADVAADAAFEAAEMAKRGDEPW